MSPGETAGTRQEGWMKGPLPIGDNKDTRPAILSSARVNECLGNARRIVTAILRSSISSQAPDNEQ